MKTAVVSSLKLYILDLEGEGEWIVGRGEWDGEKERGRRKGKRGGMAGVPDSLQIK